MRGFVGGGGWARLTRALRCLGALAFPFFRLRRLPATAPRSAQSRRRSSKRRDHHFDTLATVLTFTSQWVAPAGSID